MADVPTWPLPDPVTKFAEQYGHPPPWGLQNPFQDHDTLGNILPLKSGITPLDKTQFKTAEEKKQYDDLSAYQRRRFREGFTTAELEMLGVMTTSSSEGPSIALNNVPLHPLLVKENWQKEIPKHWALYPVRNGTGYWEASNPVVWEAILPSLQLGSMILTRPETLLWWKALYLSPRVPIPLGEIESIRSSSATQKSFPYFSFHFLGHKMASLPDSDAKLQALLSALAQNLEFHIICGTIDSYTGLKSDMVLGNTTRICREEPIMICIALEAIEALMDPNKTPAQIMLARFDLAVAILHELAHAVCFFLEEEHNVPAGKAREPYFQDEVMGEAGFSMENSVFGGLEEQLIRTENTPAKGTDSLVKFSGNWNSIAYVILGRQDLIKKKPKGWDFERLCPIPPSYFFKVQSKEYWNHHVRKYGRTTVHMGPKMIGHSINRKNPSRPFKQDLDLARDIILDASKTNAEARALKKDVARRVQAAAILEELKRISIPSTTQPNNPKAYSVSEPSCPRYEEICTYLISKRKELAIDNMEYIHKMPENVMHAHILRVGGILLSHVEWRQFLLHCDWEEEMFFFELIGAPPTSTEGLIKLRYEGWPPLVDLSSTFLPPPSTLSLEMFRIGLMHCASNMPDIWERRDHYDIDKELLRRLVNHVVSKKKWDVDGKIRSNLRLDKNIFDRCIDEYRRYGFMCWGPPGIVRKSIKIGDLESLIGGGSNGGGSNGGGSNGGGSNGGGSNSGGSNSGGSNSGGSNSGSSNSGSSNSEDSRTSTESGGSSHGGSRSGTSDEPSEGSNSQMSSNDGSGNEISSSGGSHSSSSSTSGESSASNSRVTSVGA